MNLKTPDITPAQIIALVVAVVQTAIVFGVHLTAAKQHVIIADAGILVALVFGDAVVRHGRASGNAVRDERLNP